MPISYGIDYFAVLVATLVGAAFVFVNLLIANIVAPRLPSPGKALTYECGSLPVGAYWTQMYVRYYLYTILFVIFDVEVVFLFPWAVIFKDLGALAFYEMLVFILILFFGLVYAWRKGVLQWR